jgi:hypothetical protein
LPLPPLKQLEVEMRGTVSPVSEFIPVPDVRDEHSIQIAAPAELVFETAKNADLFSHPLIAAIFRTRALVMGDRPRPRQVTGLVAETLALGWGVLFFRPGEVLVMGAVARPWARNVTFTAVDPDRFAAFSEPDLVKIVWSLEVESQGTDLTRFRTETRVVATDTTARRKFMSYWWLVSPGIRMIRWLMLRSLRRTAEERYRRSSPPLVRHAA